MYCNYFGFSEKPFDVTPDPRFLYLTSAHRETLASLIYGIQERRGFITIVGEVGTGKTTLLNAALNRLDDKTKIAFIFNTDMAFNEILNMTLYELGLSKSQDSLSKANAIQRLNDFAIQQLAKGGNVVLILDEAHILSRNAMENLRLLSNLETQRHKLVQIVLSGQPELDTKLDQYELRQLAQRINLRRYIHPLDKKSTFAYLQHRLKVVTNSDSSPFNFQAQQMIWEYSSGIPRKINMLCDNALLIGYGLKQKKINTAIIQEVAEDLKWDCISKSKPPLNYSSVEALSTSVEMTPPRYLLKLTAAMIIVVIMVLSGNIFLNSKEFRLAKLTDFFSGIKGVALETVHQEHAKEQLQMSRPDDTPEHAVLESKVVGQKVPKTNLESETRTKNEDVSFLTAFRYQLVKDKNSDFIIQDNATENRVTSPDSSLLKETISNETETPQIIPSKKLPEKNGVQTYKTKPGGPKSEGNDKITEANTAGVSNGSPENALETASLKEMTPATTEPIDTVPSNLKQRVPVTVPVTEKTPDKIQASAKMPSKIQSIAPSATVAFSDLGQNKPVTIPSSDPKRDEIEMPASKPVQVNTKPKTPDTLKNTEIEKVEPGASYVSLDKQATIPAAIPLVNSPKETVHPVKGLSGEDKVVPQKSAQPALPVTNDKKAVTRVDEKAVSLNAPASKPETAGTAGFDNSNLHARLKSFLNEYCRIYEQKDLDKFSTFFAINAVEKGKPFKFWLSKYRQNFNRIDSIEYDIKLERYVTEEELGFVRIDGIFHVRAKLVGSKDWRKNSGQISIVLEADGNSFKVRQLDY